MTHVTHCCKAIHFAECRNPLVKVICNFCIITQGCQGNTTAACNYICASATAYSAETTISSVNKVSGKDDTDLYDSVIMFTS